MRKTHPRGGSGGARSGGGGQILVGPGGPSGTFGALVAVSIADDDIVQGLGVEVEGEVAADDGDGSKRITRWRGAGSVTSAAHAHSFESLSRFGADYRARSPESPSESLRRGNFARR